MTWANSVQNKRSNPGPFNIHCDITFPLKSRSLIQYSRVIHQKPIVSQLFKTPYRLYIERFIAMFRKYLHWMLRHLNLDHTLCSSKLLLFSFFRWNVKYISNLAHVCYMPRSFYLPWGSRLNNFLRGSEFLIMHLPPFPVTSGAWIAQPV
jgi:hypothetical protein